METRYQRIEERKAARAARMKKAGRKPRPTQVEIQARLSYDHDRDFDLPGDDLPEAPQF